ncbi:alpha/beta hydrolase [Antrihabitans cavernicola]|uniref:Alpha/beta hydrolase n=2 Tax=Antrihabitans cavernicola TaxID=2495913 RepID=A0A5A7SFY7_9NOCA|nr:alpha/beta hydrolase [Spelaeibacter cavernicola]
MAGLEYVDLDITTSDGVVLHGWWIPTSRPRIGHVLFAHGNGGNIGDRILHAQLLSEAGFDVLLFDYRGYGSSAGRPSERGTYLDSRAARTALLAQDGVAGGRTFYLGESLGGGVVLELALAHPPAGVILTSTFSSVRDVAREHFAILPSFLVPDAYPNARRIAELQAPVLIQHGAVDDLVPVEQAHRNYAAAAGQKELQVIDNAGHNDLVVLAGREWVTAITSWSSRLSM